MKPNEKFITITNNRNLIMEFIQDMLIVPRQKAHKWSKITNQTPNLKIGYPFQHLASLITGMQGNAMGARGEDLIDGSEVKSCNKIDQADKCLECGQNILRIQQQCPYCFSTNIRRNNDSKWLIGVRNDDELLMLKNETPRFILMVSDYPDFALKKFERIRIRSFEIWVKSPRCRNFIALMDSYYQNIFLKHKSINPNKNPAPKNLFPDNYPFYMCNPIKTFECLIDEKLHINITHFVEPNADRTCLDSEKMPKNLLKNNEISTLKAKFIDCDSIDFIDEKMRSYLSLRDSDKQIKIIGNKQHKALK